ncbi:MAG: hypothetical protein IJZ95_09805, partial [Oscillospiraceae bacterium]|nr:hypothetical protein [Oscillospiraceae bacterium]
GEAMDETGEAMDETGEAMDETGEAMDETGEAMDETGEAMDDTGDAPDDTTETAPPITIELSDDLSTAIMDGVKYILTDDGSSPPPGDMEFSDRFDGTTEYWVDIYGGEYFVLSTMDGRIIGGYKKAE